MNPEAIRVMQVLSNLDIGGAQEVVRTLAWNLAQAGCRSVVCTFKDGPLRKEIEQLGVPVEILPQRRYSVLALPWFLLDMLRIRHALVGLVKRHEINVIQTHLLRSLDFLVLSLRLELDVLVFWTFHNFRFDLRDEHLARHKWLLKPKRWGYRLLYRLGMRWANGLIAVAEDVRTAIQQTIPGVPDEKIVTICNSVDVSRYGDQSRRMALRHSLGLRGADRVAAVVANFKEQKGHRYLLEAAPAVINRFPNLHILFIGDGELREALQSQTREACLDKNIHFLGSRNDVPDLLAASDYFILPSLWEGLPMALIEAMASGLPVIATQVSGTNQVMVSGETGFLAPPGDAERLANVLLELLSDPGRAAAMGAAARQRVEKYFSAQRQAREHIGLYENELAAMAPSLALFPRR